MRVDTKLWVLNQRQGRVTLPRTVGSEAFLMDDNGWVGHSLLDKVQWCSGGKIVKVNVEDNPSSLTLPRISLLNDRETAVEWINYHASRLVGFATGLKSPPPVSGTIHLIDLWIVVEDGTPRTDFALMLALSDFDVSRLTPIPEFYGWTGITHDDNPPVVRKSRYQREWVI